jgi:hypothetical protein
MTGGRKAIAAAIVAACVLIGGTVGVMRAFAGDGGENAPPVIVGGAALPAKSDVQQTKGQKLLGTWVAHGGGITLTSGGYQGLDTPITVVCKKEPCLLVAHKTVVAFSAANGNAVAPCVLVDGGGGGSNCTWVGSSQGFPQSVNFGGGSTEIKDLVEGAHTVQLGAYTNVSGTTVGGFDVVYQLYH